MANRRAAIIAAALALLLFAPGVWWGLPNIDGRAAVRSWAIDDEAPLGLLAEISNIRSPRADRNLGYPLFYTFTSVAAYAPYLGYLKLTGRFSRPSADYPYGLKDPTRTLRTLSLLSKCLTLLFGVCAVVGALLFARANWGPVAGAFAAAFVATMYPLSYYARTGNVDVPMLGMTALGLAAYARIVHDGLNARRAVALGVFAGFALATKEASLGAFLAVPLALPFIRSAGETTSARSSWRLWALAGGVAVLALGVGSGFFIEPRRYIDHLRYLTGRVEYLPQATAVAFTLPFTAEGHVAYMRYLGKGLVSILTLPGLALALAGIVWSWRRSWHAALLLLPGLTYLAFVFVLLRSSQLRYLLPLGFVLAIFAGAGLAAGVRASSRVVRGAALALGVAAIGLGLLRWLDLTYAMMHDSRYAAANWLAASLRPGDHVEYFGGSQKLPRLPDSVSISRATDFSGMYTTYDTSAAKVAEILAGWQTRNPRFVLVIPDHSSRTPDTPYDGTVPPALYRALEAGNLPYHRVAFFHTPPLIPALHRPPLDYPTVNPPVHIYGR